MKISEYNDLIDFVKKKSPFTQQEKEYNAKYIGSKVKIIGGNYVGREGVIKRIAGFSGVGPKFLINLSSTRNNLGYGSEVVIPLIHLEIIEEDK